MKPGDRPLSPSAQNQGLKNPSPNSSSSSITKPPAVMADTTRKERPRWMLVAQARMWRRLMDIGMFLHKTARPWPLKPAFTKTLKTTVSSRPGKINLHFYVPKGYRHRNPNTRFPVVVNFHGGGFTIGRATDDARWCGTVVEEVGAIVVSVDYRLAPEHPFPTAVDDGADAVIWLVQNADSLGIDIERIALSGFSSGGNMCFSVPLRLQEYLQEESADGEDHRHSVVTYQRPPLQKSFSQGRVLRLVRREVRIKAICAWYPPTDYTRTRAQRRATAKCRLDQLLAARFTDLFDESYLQPPTMDMRNPYLSPGVAPNHLLAGLPEEIMIFACEWDMLVVEAEEFRDRLAQDLDKTVHYHLLLGVPHAWDKAPNPLRVTPGVDAQYLKACKELKRLLNDESLSQATTNTESRGAIVDETLVQ